MPVHEKPLTDGEARKIDTPSTGYVIHWCPRSPGLGLRVTAKDARAWVFERRVNGKTIRRTLGKANGRGAISVEAARRMQVDVSSELQQGVDRLELRREEARAAAEEGVTFAQALREYVKGKRRGKDGLPLKARTRADYLAMIQPGGMRKNGKPMLDGELFTLANRSLTKISGDDIRALYESLTPRGPRRAAYGLQVVRAVLNWHGVKVAGSPLDKATAGRDRIVLPQSKGRPSPIPAEKLGAWWTAATKQAKSPDAEAADGADACRLLLLTGCRPGELLGSEHAPALRVQDVDLKAARFKLADTKNRTDHTVLLSAQALAIVAKHAQHKRKGAALFDVADRGGPLSSINAAAGVEGITAHDLRATFASIAEAILPLGTVKLMLNHATAGDVTLGHYVGRSEAQLRQGWQAVADFIEEQCVAPKRQKRRAAS